MTFEDFKNTEQANILMAKLRRKLKQRDFDISEVTDNDLLDEIESAIEAVNGRRHFVPTETKLYEEKYNNIIIRLCICSFSKMGAEGELAHSENNISRTYAGASEYPNDILKEIVPLGRIKEL